MNLFTSQGDGNLAMISIVLPLSGYKPIYLKRGRKLTDKVDSSIMQLSRYKPIYLERGRKHSKNVLDHNQWFR